MALRCYLDEDLPKALARLLRDLGHDAVYTREVGNAGRLDPDQLAFAARHGRVLLSSNLDDFRMLHETWLIWVPEWGGASGRPHPGIIVLPNANAMPEETMATVVDRFAAGLDPEALQNRLVRYRLAHGWDELSTIRGPRSRRSDPTVG